tara:strand:- start:346 stop:675 length:330 start_codon:yes stop_codon:yes gene_type:complete
MKVSYQDLLKFIIPSSIGVLLFLTPIFIDGRATIGMGILVDLLRDATQDYLPAFATMLLLVSCLCSTYFSLFRKNQSNTNQSDTTNIHHITRLVDPQSTGQSFCSSGLI